eukprot:g20784.t1
MVKTWQSLGLGLAVELVAGCRGGFCLRSGSDIVGANSGGSDEIGSSGSDVNCVGRSDVVGNISGRGHGSHMVNGASHIEGEVLDRGMAMDTCIGPSYACLFIAYMERSFFHCSGTIPQLFLHYIDDCIGAVLCSHEELEQFINFTNTFHPNL